MKGEMKTYQIYCDRGQGPSLEGCWGSENARYYSLHDAKRGASTLSEIYPDCAWVVMEGNQTIYRIEAKETK